MMKMMMTAKERLERYRRVDARLDRENEKKL